MSPILKQVEERMGRKCRAIELDPVFVNRTIARWEKFTDKKAELVTHVR